MNVILISEHEEIGVHVDAGSDRLKIPCILSWDNSVLANEFAPGRSGHDPVAPRATQRAVS